jgi:hypothetical protein
MIFRSGTRTFSRFPARILWLLAALGFAASWQSCLSEGPSTETGNPNLEGTLLNAQGRPVPGTVKLFVLAGGKPRPDTAHAAALTPPTLVATLIVGADGKFRFDSLPVAVYSLEGADAAAANFALLPDLTLASDRAALERNLTVNPPARLVGKVTRGPDARPDGVNGDAGILIRVGGVDRFAYSDTAGNYALDKVPEGRYRIAFAAQDGHYEPKYLDSARAVSGETDTLPLVELDWSRYLAPPAVVGLEARVDSAAGAVRLAWRTVKLANLVHYEVSRRDSLDPANDTVFLTTDTAYADTFPASAAGHILAYRVTAVNALGNRGPEGTESDRSVVAPTLPDPLPGATGTMGGVVHQGGLPRSGAAVHLYPIPSGTGSPDSLPHPLQAADSAHTDAAGRYRFSAVKPGNYTLTVSFALAGPGVAGDEAAVRIGVPVRAGMERLDSLEPQTSGSVEGLASRDSLWVTAPFKGDDGIWVGLVGSPYYTLTGYGAPGTGGAFKLKGVPPGDYSLVVHAGPQGYFLPDTLAVKVVSGTATTLPALIKARYNPAAPPPKISSLAIKSSSRNAVSLAWDAVARYAPLKGYRVLRLDEDFRQIAASGVLTATTYGDDISALASGTQLYYVVKVVNQAGVEGQAGSDGNPAGTGLPFRVP